MSKDLAESLVWLNKAGKMGRADAYAVLAGIYGGPGIDGYPRMVREDRALQQKYRKMAADGGDRWSQLDLGMDALGNRDAPKDRRRARQWFELIASQPMVFAPDTIRAARFRLQELDGNWYPSLSSRDEPCSHVPKQ